MKILVVLVFAALTVSAIAVRARRPATASVAENQASRGDVARELCLQSVLDRGGDEAKAHAECDR